MLGDLSYYHRGARSTVFSTMQPHQPHNDVAEHIDSNRCTFPVPRISLIALRLQAWIFAILLLTLVSPVVIGDNSACLSEYWCVSTGADDCCSFYSSQTAATVQLCSCIAYQHNFTVCLNNVSAFNISEHLNF